MALSLLAKHLLVGSVASSRSLSRFRNNPSIAQIKLLNNLRRPDNI